MHSLQYRGFLVSILPQMVHRTGYQGSITATIAVVTILLLFPLTITTIVTTITTEGKLSQLLCKSPSQRLRRRSGK